MIMRQELPEVVFFPKVIEGIDKGVLEKLFWHKDGVCQALENDGDGLAPAADSQRLRAREAGMRVAFVDPKFQRMGGRFVPLSRQRRGGRGNFLVRSSRAKSQSEEGAGGFAVDLAE